MKLNELLTPQRVLPAMQATTPWEAMEELVDYLIEIGRVSREAREGFLDALRKREDQVSTGIGHGVAIPHAYCGSLTEVEAVLGRSVEGIEFETPDNAPVKFVILLLVPESQANLHLQTLASVAGVFSKGGIRTSLKGATTSDEICEILLGAEATPV